MDRAERAYPNNRETILVVFGIREARAAQSTHLRRAALRELGDLEFLDEDHAVLIALAGVALRLAS